MKKILFALFCVSPPLATHPPHMRTPSLAVLLPVLAAALPACGTPKQESKTARSILVDDEAEDESEDDMEMMQEFGGMNEDKVTRVFNKLSPELSECLTKQSENQRYLAGDVAFLVKVDRSGQAVAAHAEDSTLGSFEAERCMLKILRASHWPKPVGGLIGNARSSIRFTAPGDVRAPIEWTTSDIATTLDRDSTASALASCGSGGPYKLTAYISKAGKVISAGVAHTDDQGEATAECLVTKLEEIAFPSPGSWQAKVSFTR